MAATTADVPEILAPEPGNLLAGSCPLVYGGYPGTIIETKAGACLDLPNGFMAGTRFDLPHGTTGRYLVSVCRGTVEQVAGTGTRVAPVLSVLLLATDQAGARVVAQTGGTCRGNASNGWVDLADIVEIPSTTTAIEFDILQDRQTGAELTGQSARLRDLGLYLFDSKEEADAFVSEFRQGTVALPRANG